MEGELDQLKAQGRSERKDPRTRPVGLVHIPLPMHVKLPDAEMGQLPQDAARAAKLETTDYCNFNGGMYAFRKLSSLADLFGLPYWHGSEVDLGIYRGQLRALECRALEFVTMTQTKYDSCNPFPLSDVDRHEIWEILVHRDVTAFVEADWLKVADDFDSESFVGYSGSSNPDHWTIAFPSLEAYRTEWERQAVEFQEMKLVGEDTKTFLFKASLLRDIDIHGNAAMAHKKINGRALTTEGLEVVRKWQTVYWLRRVAGRWRVTGFLGYLPNPMPPIEPTLTGPSTERSV